MILLSCCEEKPHIFLTQATSELSAGPLLSSDLIGPLHVLFSLSAGDVDVQNTVPIQFLNITYLCGQSYLDTGAGDVM